MTGTALRRATVTTEDGEISYLEAGPSDAPVSVFVHGVFLNALLWRNVIASLPGRRCIAIDLPAHGQTHITAGHDLSLPAQAELIERFCDAVGLGPVDMVANDSGGAIAQVLAVRYPGRLRSLTLTNCDVHDNLPPPAFKPIVDLAAAGELGPVAAQMLADPDLARSEAGLGAGYEHPERLDDATVTAYLEPCVGTADAARELERFLNSLVAGDLVSIEPDLRRLDVPTLIVWGTGDVFFETSWAYWLRDTIPGASEVVEIEGAKLFFPDERAADLVPHLERHWASVEALAQPRTA